jgi:hypothetical protein
MLDASFQRTNLDWQVQQWRRWVGEWLELQFRERLEATSLPQWTISPLLLRTLFWVIVTCVIVWSVWQLYHLLSPHINPFGGFDRHLGKSALGRKHPQTVTDWLGQAQEWRRRGDYGQACQALYMAMLQRLDDTKQLPHQLSRTDGEYLRVIQTFPKPQPYQVLIATHEQVCFGNIEASLATFHHCQQAYREIEAS